LGSDTGGSVRQPASFCGVVGLKPTYGSISRNGLMAYGSSLDQVGPITKTIEDCRTVFHTIKGEDKLDSSTVPTKKPVRFDKSKIEDLVIGVPKEFFIDGVDKDVKEVVEDAIKRYEKMGAKIKEISLPHIKYSIPTYYILSASEASTNLARFDGVKYGLSKEGNLIDSYLETRGKGFGKEVRRRIMLGTFALSSGYYDAYYLKAQKVRMLIKKDFEEAFQEVDIIVSPTSPTPAFKIGEKTQDPVQMYLSDIFTVPVNIANLCAISIPCGEVEVNSKKLPVGLQLIGKPFEEDKIMDIGKLIEK
jgi:aspartyl-tRNA(Asn)/glutamyl-tRNA(Gln) amidotransferase subunit A